MMSLKFLKKFGVQKIKKETTKARQKSLPFKSLSFVNTYRLWNTSYTKTQH